MILGDWCNKCRPAPDNLVSICWPASPEGRNMDGSQESISPTETSPAAAVVLPAGAGETTHNTKLCLYRLLISETGFKDAHKVDTGIPKAYTLTLHNVHDLPEG